MTHETNTHIGSELYMCTMYSLNDKFALSMRSFVNLRL